MLFAALAVNTAAWTSKTTSTMMIMNDMLCSKPGQAAGASHGGAMSYLLSDGGSSAEKPSHRYLGRPRRYLAGCGTATAA